MARTRTENLEQWRGRLNSSKLPVFSRTVRDIRNVSTSRESSARDLSDVIGHDASMTARVIQIANSPLFNLQNREIDTINAAVVLVGFDAVRDLMISVSVIEEMLKGRQHARVGQTMARAFHAAAQARAFARTKGDSADEVFVGALLKHVGDMAFWSRAEREAVAVEAEIVQGADPAQAEKNVLGFELSQLSRLLADDWNLGELVVHVLDGRHNDDPLVQHIELAHEIAEVTELYGLDSDEAKVMIAKVAEHLDIKTPEAEQMVLANFDEVASISKHFGLKPTAEKASAEVGQSAGVYEAEGQSDHALPSCSEADANGSSVCADPFNAAQLLDCLDDIADKLEQGASRDELMRLVVNGLYSALGLRVVYFSLFSPDRTRLYIKYVAGDVAAEKLIGLSTVAEQDVFFNDAMQSKKMVVFTSSANDDAWHYGGAGAVMAVTLGGRSVGLLYGEVVSGEELMDEQKLGFRQLGQQIALILSQATE